MKAIIISTFAVLATWIALACLYDMFFKSLMITLLIACAALLVHIVIRFVRTGNC